MAKKYKTHRLRPIVYDALTGFPFIERDFDALTTYELTSIIIGRLNDCIDIVNDLDDTIEGKVQEKLQEWLDDGTLASIINETLFERYNLFYTPEDFGGVGDGETDCSEAFDAACHAIAEGNIKTLYIPAGKTYLIKTTISLPENCLLIGSGETSRIYYDETYNDFGAGITTGGDNITIKNLRIDHKTTDKIIMGQAMTGALSIGGLAYVGATENGVEYTRENRKNVVVDKIWTNGRYCIQTENYVRYDGDDVAESYSIENVTVSNIISPIGVVSISPKLGLVKNVHYHNIDCDVLRVGGQYGQYGESISVDGFRCHGLYCRARNASVSNGLIDCSGDTNNEMIHGIRIAADSTLTNVKAIGGNSQYTTCIYGEGRQGMFRFINCDFSGFPLYWWNPTSDPIPQLVSFYSGCNVSQTEPMPETINSHHIIYGTAVGGNIDLDLTLMPLGVVDRPVKVTGFTLTSDTVSSRYPRSITFQNHRMYVKMMNNIDENVTAENKIATYGDKLARFFKDSVDDELVVTLYNRTSGAINFTTAYVDTESRSLILRTNGITLSDYDTFAIDDSIALKDYNITA